MESIIAILVVIPVLVVTADKTDTKVDLFAHGAPDGRDVQGKDKLVGKSVAWSGHVGAGRLVATSPFIGGVFDQDLLVEVQIDDSDDAFDGIGVTHVGGFQADFFVS